MVQKGTTKFVQKLRVNHEPLNLEIETLYGVEIKSEKGGVRIAKVPITRQDKRVVVETNNCPTPVRPSPSQAGA